MLRQWPHIDSLEDIRPDIRPSLLAVFKCTGSGWVELKSGKFLTTRTGTPTYSPSPLGGYEQRFTTDVCMSITLSQIQGLYQLTTFAGIVTASSVSTDSDSRTMICQGNDSGQNQGWAYRSDQYGSSDQNGFTKLGVSDRTFSSLTTSEVPAAAGFVYQSNEKVLGFNETETQEDDNTSAINATPDTFAIGASVKNGNVSDFYRGNIGPYIFFFDASVSVEQLQAFIREPSRLVRNRILEMLPTWYVAAGGGGSTYENSITLATSLAQSDTGIFSASPSISLGASLAQSDGGLIEAFSSAAFGSTLGQSNSGGLVIDASVSLAAGLAASDGGSLTIEQAITLAKSVTQSASGNIELSASVVMALSKAIAASTQLDAGNSISLAGSFGIAASDGGGTIYESALTLALSCAAAGSSQADLHNSLTYAISKALTASAVGVFDNSASLGGSVGVSATGGNDFAESLTFGTNYVASVSPAYIIAGSATLAAQLGIIESSQLDGNNSLSISATVSAAVAASAILNSSASFGGVFTVSALGSVVGALVTTPDGRKVLIYADDRRLTIEADDRTLSILQ